MEFVELSPAEKSIINIYRTLKPYEIIVIEADKDGKADRAWIKRESKIIIHGAVVNFTK